MLLSLILKADVDGNFRSVPDKLILRTILGCLDYEYIGLLSCKGV